MAKVKPLKLSTDPVPSIVANVYHLSGLFRRWGDRIAETVGQTGARWQVLSAASKGDQTVAQIGRRLSVSRQNVQRIADLLADDGSVAYEYNRNHKRSPHVRLTPKGIESLAALSKAAVKFHGELAEGLPLRDLRAASIVLRKFAIQIQRDLTNE